MASIFEELSEKRQRSQGRLEKETTGKRKGRVIKTISTSEEDWQRLQRYAHEHYTSVSDVIRQWIHEFC